MAVDTMTIAVFGAEARASNYHHLVIAYAYCMVQPGLNDVCNRAMTFSRPDSLNYRLSSVFLSPQPEPALPPLAPPSALMLQCSTPGCTRPRRMMADGSGYYDYCSIRCRDQNLPAGISQCMLTCDCCILVSNNHKVLVLLYTVTSLKRKAGRRLTDCILLIDFIYAWLIMYTPYELFSWLQTN